MKKIKDYVDKIADEIEGSKEYIEKALWYKAKNINNIKKIKLNIVIHIIKGDRDFSIPKSIR